MGKRKSATMHDFFSKKNKTSTIPEDIVGLNLPATHGGTSTSEVPLVEISGVTDENFNLNSLEVDPGKRQQIWEYPIHQQDEIRRAYISLKAYQPKLSEYPSTQIGEYNRRFQYSWFSIYSWLEYSPTKDKAFCFPCFLFNKPSGEPKRKTFTVNGFNTWNKVRNGKKCSFLKHFGVNNPDSTHRKAQQALNDLNNQPQHIQKVLDKFTSDEIANNRLRIMGSIKVIRLLANQGCSFRGHDESPASLNRGNFIEFLSVLASETEKLSDAVKNAPQNAKYTFGDIQKQILHVYSVRVKNIIRAEISDSKLCLLVDKARDGSKKEQMSIVLRFVDNKGFIQELFFGLVHVKNTASLTLKDVICSVLAHHNLDVQCIRGQGYDGASNMRGEFNGLQALIMKDCPYAYYIHCFAHRLQLALVAASKVVIPINHFFSKLMFIVNIVGASCKRVDELKYAYSEEISYLIDKGELETGRGLNQVGTLQRHGDTRWSSHLKAMSSLTKMFSPACIVLLNIIDEGNTDQRADASSVYDSMTTFDFVFVLNIMKAIMEITDSLCQALQKKSQDILNAMRLVSSTKNILQQFKDDKWDNLLDRVSFFCQVRNIDIPDLNAKFVDRRGKARNQLNNFTVKHHYQIDIFYAAIDSQLQEINGRFSESAMELLILSSALNPRNSFKISYFCLLVDKFYPVDFTRNERLQLEMQLQHYEWNVVKHPEYTSLLSVSELCQWLVKNDMSDAYNLVFRLIVLVLTLPVSTATTERTFSAMNAIKTSDRNKMDDEYLTDAMMIYIEKEIAQSISNDEILEDFRDMKERRVLF